MKGAVNLVLVPDLVRGRMERVTAKKSRKMKVSALVYFERIENEFKSNLK